MPDHRTSSELEAGISAIAESPQDHGTLELIVVRPATDSRQQVDTMVLDEAEGLVDDCWNLSTHTDDRGQVSLMNSRVLSLVAGSPERMPLAGDNLIVDLDLSEANLPAGARLLVGDATVELTDLPHTGCSKFEARYGSDAKRFINSPAGRQANLRGRYARVVKGGCVAVGDEVRRDV